jgi:hypothetical protein
MGDHPQGAMKRDGWRWSWWRMRWAPAARPPIEIPGHVLIEGVAGLADGWYPRRWTDPDVGAGKRMINEMFAARRQDIEAPLP